MRAVVALVAVGIVGAAGCVAIATVYAPVALEAERLGMQGGDAREMEDAWALLQGIFPLYGLLPWLAFAVFAAGIAALTLAALRARVAAERTPV